MRLKAYQLIVLLCCLSSQSSFGRQTAAIEIVVLWEGRDIQEPNLDALSAFRETETDIPIVHLFNAHYFLTQENRANYLNKLQTLLHDKDEVGLYLTAQRRVLQAARVIPRSMPSFWSHLSENRYCDEDCGLDVPLHIFPREDLVKIFTTAESSLRKAGFNRLRTFTVRGGFKVPVLAEIAGSFGFRTELSQLDPGIFRDRFDHYPIAQWISDQALAIGGDAVPFVQVSPSKGQEIRGSFAGGFVDIQETPQILKRFSLYIEKSREVKTSSFQLYLSQETAYLGVPRLKSLVNSIRETAKARDIDLEFRTHSGEKNGRPLEVEQRITGNL